MAYSIFFRVPDVGRSGQFARLFISIIFFSLLLGACKAPSELEYQYAYQTKSLKEKEAGQSASYTVSKRPIPFPATRELQMSIVDYNPLSTEIVVEDSSISVPLGDTGKLASMISFPVLTTTGANPPIPEVESMPIGNNVNPDFVLLIRGDSLSSFIRKSANKNNADCILLQANMSDLDNLMDKMQAKIALYREFLARVDVISNDYEYLKSLPVLRATDVSGQLQRSFLARLNSFLPASLATTGNPVSTSGADIERLEERYYRDITDFETAISGIEEAVEVLKGNCPSFVDLFKKYTKAVEKAKESLRELKKEHTDKLLPALAKKIVLYDQLRGLMQSDPVYHTRGIPIDKDKHFVVISFRSPGSTTTTVYDRIGVEPKRGFKASVSAGVFVSSLYDDAFSKKTKDSIFKTQYLLDGNIRDTTLMKTFTSIHVKKQSKISYGGMLYLHAMSQRASYFNFGGYVGFGALFNDQARWAGAAGLSCVIGKSQKFGVHVGAIMCQTERLSPPYEAGKWYAETVDNIPTYKGMNTGFMVGFSWRL